MITKLHAAVRKGIDTDAAPGRLQVCFFSATLHSPEIGKLSELLCRHPTWVDLKGKDSVPETVHHVLVTVNPESDRSWAARKASSSSSGAAAGFDAEVPTDGVHAKDRIDGSDSSSSSGGAGAGAGKKRPLSPE